MSLLQKIQNQPQAVKMRIIWIICIVVVILLILAWIFSSRFHKNTSKDFRVFQTIGQGILDVKNNYNK